MHKKLACVIAALAGLAWCLNAYAQYSVQSIPNPKTQGNDHYVSDPDGNLSGSTRAQLDAISTGIEHANGSEFAVVVVNDYQGDSDFSFALDLFTHWGIGKQGSDNGLLLFLGMDRREYRFISGYGVEGVFPDALLKQIGENYLVPYLKAGNTDMAVLATAKAVESVFLSPAHGLELAGLQAYRPTFWNRHAAALEQTLYVLAVFAVGFGWISLARKRVLKKYAVKRTEYKQHSLWYALFLFLFSLFLSLFVFLFMEVIERVYQFKNLPYFAAAFGTFLLLFHYYGCREFLKKSTRDKKTSLDMQVSFTRLSLVPLLLSPFTYKAYYDLGKNSKNARLRAIPPATAGKWSRVNRDAFKRADLKKYLNELQMREEALGAKAYEIWRDPDTGKTRIIEFAGDKAARYMACPKCHGRTLQKPEIKVRKRATRTQTGTGERMQECAFCDYAISLGMVTLAKLQGSSSSSGGSSGGGSSSSSSGGSFGGGSSGGGGAGARW
ncbi:YgcG family protein [Bordetella sp. BOR01]|uniref:TPM domain-containing protein n=1 Tax=Bordetella sp. BOR01 TaxID=2854779 RepID=UPI001C48519C|nr:TPM domain-containing protein [Bordetella sp. BOR01]MBV7483347.1 TPM domain-containing protein [Bordetella sp. BOR01]